MHHSRHQWWWMTQYKLLSVVISNRIYMSLYDDGSSNWLLQIGDLDSTFEMFLFQSIFGLWKVVKPDENTSYFQRRRTAIDGVGQIWWIVVCIDLLAFAIQVKNPNQVIKLWKISSGLTVATSLMNTMQEVACWIWFLGELTR